MAHEFEKMEADVLEKEIRHDEDVIDAKRGDLNMHEAENDHDSSKFMKDLHNEEIKHDEKVIDRKEERAEKHEEKLKETEQKICGCGCGGKR